MVEYNHTKREETDMIDNITMNLRDALRLAVSAECPNASADEFADAVDRMEDFFNFCSKPLAEQYRWSSLDLQALAALAYRGE